MEKRPRFDREFKSQAVGLVRSSVRPRCEIAASLGVSSTTLGRWMSEMVEPEGGEAPLSESERAELRALRKERAEWAIEREILKKAMAWWVKESKG